MQHIKNISFWCSLDLNFPMLHMFLKTETKRTKYGRYIINKYQNRYHVFQIELKCLFNNYWSFPSKPLICGT
jgi:hypothetical protein